MRSSDQVNWGITVASKSKRSGQSFNQLASRVAIDRLAFRARLAIKIVGGGLALIFTWLQLKGIPITPFVESIEPLSLLKLILTGYYFCWLGGRNYEHSNGLLFFNTRPFLSNRCANF